MNAVSNSNSSADDFIQENAEGSDSDTNANDSPDYYQPISADDVEDVSDPADSDRNSDDDSDLPRLANGYAHGVENGISSIDLSDDEERKSNEEEEEESMRVATDSAILRAFREHESRRNTPLTPETATRVREAMRGVSFNGLAPNWADRVPEDQWINQLRSLRGTVTSIRD